MVRRCSDQMAKILLITFNLVFLVSGLAIVILSFTASHPASFDELVKGFKSVNHIFLGVGITISIISFIGCCGAWMENKCMLNLFLILLVVILITEGSVGTYAYVKRGTIKKSVKDEGMKLLKQNNTASWDVFDNIQKPFKCCGMDGADDYTNNKIPVPKSCCEDLKENETCKPYPQGCYGVIEGKINSNLSVVGATAFSIILVEIIGIILSCCLRGGVGEKYQYV